MKVTNSACDTMVATEIDSVVAMMSVTFDIILINNFYMFTDCFIAHPCNGILLLLLFISLNHCVVYTGVALGDAVNRVAIFHLCSRRNAGIAVRIIIVIVIWRFPSFAHVSGSVYIDQFVVHVEQAVSLCVCVCVFWRFFERNGLWPTYMARQFVLTLSGSNSKVKNQDHSLMFTVIVTGGKIHTVNK